MSFDKTNVSRSSVVFSVMSVENKVSKTTFLSPASSRVFLGPTSKEASYAFSQRQGTKGDQSLKHYRLGELLFCVGFVRAQTSRSTGEKVRLFVDFGPALTTLFLHCQSLSASLCSSFPVTRRKKSVSYMYVDNLQCTCTYLNPCKIARETESLWVKPKHGVAGSSYYSPSTSPSNPEQHIDYNVRVLIVCATLYSYSIMGSVH